MTATRLTAAACAAFLVGGWLTGAAAAQSYPTQPVKIVVPFPPGGPTDVTARTLSGHLAPRLGQPVIIESRPGGAGGTIGAKYVASSDPDGYTLLLALTGTLTISPAIYKNSGYDPIKSFTPVAILTSSAQVLVVNPGLPVGSLAELVAYAKANPGKISYSSPGFGTQPHLLGELLKLTTGINIVHVPYKGSAPAITDLLAGQVQMMFDSPVVMLPHVQADKLKLLAVTSPARMPQMPQTPTVAEAGFPKLTATLWAGVVAPAGTPASIVNKLNTAINETLDLPIMRTTLATLGSEPQIASSQEFAAFLKAEVQKWGEVVEAAGIRGE
jgi:tripartite-type tricarboxylate transporter receptor subunit TctC